MYDRKADKNEKKKISTMVNMIKEKYMDFMGKYELVPHKESVRIKDIGGNWKQNGYLNLCWCQPKNAKSCNATLEDIKNRQ